MAHPFSEFSHFFSLKLRSIHWCFYICLVPSSLYLKVNLKIHPRCTKNSPLFQPGFTLRFVNLLPDRNLGHQFQDSKYSQRIGGDHLWYTTSSGHPIRVEIHQHDGHHNQQKDSTQLQKLEPNEHLKQDEFFRYSSYSFQIQVYGVDSLWKQVGVCPRQRYVRTEKIAEKPLWLWKPKK